MSKYVSNRYHIAFSDKDVLNPDDLLSYKHLFVFTDHGHVIAAVFQDTLQDAYDEIADRGKLDHLEIQEEDLGDYTEDLLDYFGNYCKPYDVEGVDVYVFNTPPLSISALLYDVAMKGEAIYHGS